MRKLRKDERLCEVCGKIYRVRQNRQKYCSKDCHDSVFVEKKRQRMKKIQSLGTPSTWNLSPKSVKKQLYYIRHNIDNNKGAFSSEDSRRDFYLKNMAFEDLL